MLIRRILVAMGQHGKPTENVTPARHLDCRGCGHLPFSDWGVLDADELESLSSAKVIQVYRAGEVLFHQGDDCRGIYCIVDGLVGVRRTDAGGNSVLLRPLVGSGGMIGVCALYAGENHRGSAEALRETQVCFINATTVNKLLDSNPELTRRFLTRLAKAVGDAEEAFFESAVLNVRTRLFHVLLGFEDRHGYKDEDGTLHIELPISRQDLAAMIGVRPESLSRVVHKIEQEGIAAFSMRKVQVFKTECLSEGLVSSFE